MWRVVCLLEIAISWNLDWGNIALIQSGQAGAGDRLHGHSDSPSNHLAVSYSDATFSGQEGPMYSERGISYHG